VEYHKAQKCTGYEEGVFFFNLIYNEKASDVKYEQYVHIINAAILSF